MPLLETKLYAPQPQRGLVARPRLSERLSRGADAKLTLLSAPPGFGKSTLLAEWLASADTNERSVAWLSLDDGDNDPASFWAYLTAALQTAASSDHTEMRSLPASPQLPTDAVLAALLNKLNAMPKDLVLVLDDFHVIESRDVRDGVSFLLNHLPSQVHLVFSSRADPALPLARMRARGDLIEIRATDLRFTRDEAATFLNEVMGLELSAREVSALEARTEGWIAALQLAALSMQGRDDVGSFIGGFAGDNRYIVDYLMEEVLQRQSDPVRSFLLQTSVLDRLNGPLCDAVTAHANGKAMLEALERENLFVVALDDRRQWYRYHQLFADVLRARLREEQAEIVPVLHERASAWLELNGQPSEAIRHALAADNPDRAAELIERAVPSLRRSRQETTLLGWLRALPEKLVRSSPILSNAYAGVLLASGETADVEMHLRDAEQGLESTAQRSGPKTGASIEAVGVDEAELHRLPGSIAVHRAGHALARGNLAETVAYARQALDLVPEDDHLGRGGAAGLLGLAAWTSGDLEPALQSYAAAMASLQLAGHLSDALGCAIALADIRMVQGRLHEAMRTYEQALQLTDGPGASVLRGTADMHVGMSELCREWNDLSAATRHLMRSDELGEYAGLPQNRYRWRVAMARIREAEGDLDGALKLLEGAERVYQGDFFPNVRPVATWKARVWIRQDRLGEALGWAHERGLSTEDDLSYLREFEHVTLARLLLAQARIDRADAPMHAAIGLLERLAKAAEAGGRTRSTLEMYVLQALAHQTRGDPQIAGAMLERALTLAEPEGYVRIFVDEGPAMASLLAVAAQAGNARHYARRLLAALGAAEDGPPAIASLVEPLSERERDVLRLLNTELDGPDIARELMVSLNTMRTHTKSIYSKLGVNSRRAAVRRAEELGLLPRPHNR